MTSDSTGRAALVIEITDLCRRLAAMDGLDQDEPSVIETTIREVMGRESAHHDLARVQALLTTAIAQSPAGILIADAPDGAIRLANPAARAMLDRAERSGSDLPDLLGRDYRVFDIEGKPLAPEELPMHRVIKGGETIRNEEMLVCNKDGTRHLIQYNAAPIQDGEGRISAGMVIFHDATELRRQAEALRESEERLRSIIRVAPIGIGLVVDRILQSVNDLLCQMTGYTPAELIGSNSRMLYPTQEEFDYVGREKYSQIKAKGRGTVETRWRCKDGRVIDVLLSSSPLDMANLAKGVTFTALDITSRKEHLEEKLALERQIQHAQKLESLGVLAGGIAHDFNNLLMAILGNADLALDRLSPMSPARPNIQEIEKASKRAADLAKQMLAYSGKGRFVTVPIVINELVEEISHLLEVSISKKAILKFNLAANIPTFAGDATQIRQVVMNLITNASEAIGDKSGVIALSTGAMRCTREYLASVESATLLGTTNELAEGIYTYIEVADTGCGMDRATIDRVFDPFFTTKFTGRGLGMSATLGIIRGHGGAIKIYSEPGRGSTFKILFPATELAIPTAEERPGRGDDFWQGAGTILIADDEDTVCAVGKKMLEHMGFDVLTAGDGREALQVFGSDPAGIVCVLLDLTMPHLDGEEAFREMRRLRPEVKVILCSGYNEQDATQRFLGKGLAGFLQKPYGLEALRELLKSILPAR